LQNTLSFCDHDEGFVGDRIRFEQSKKACPGSDAKSRRDQARIAAGVVTGRSCRSVGLSFRNTDRKCDPIDKIEDRI
jgi:hypothetical protein